MLEKKIGVDWSRQSQKRASSAASVFKSFFTTGLEDLLLTRGAVDATPFAVAFSLTFSLVKN
jgi:hypothetical protein